jgi:hypothetical protein
VLLFLFAAWITFASHDNDPWRRLFDRDGSDNVVEVKAAAGVN